MNDAWSTRPKFDDNSDWKLNAVYAFIDSDFAGCLDTCRSTSGMLLMMNGGMVSVKSNRQSTVKLCTAAAEMDAMVKTAVKIKFARSILEGLGCTQFMPTCLFCDNKAAITVSEGQNFSHETVRQVDVQVKYMKESIENKWLKLIYLKTNKNPADILTKAVPGPAFREHRDFTMGEKILLLVSVLQTCNLAHSDINFRIFRQLEKLQSQDLILRQKFLYVRWKILILRLML